MLCACSLHLEKRKTLLSMFMKAETFRFRDSFPSLLPLPSCPFSVSSWAYVYKFFSLSGGGAGDGGSAPSAPFSIFVLPPTHSHPALHFVFHVIFSPLLLPLCLVIGQLSPLALQSARMTKAADGNDVSVIFVFRPIRRHPPYSLESFGEGYAYRRAKETFNTAFTIFTLLTFILAWWGYGCARDHIFNRRGECVLLWRLGSEGPGVNFVLFPSTFFLLFFFFPCFLIVAAHPRALHTTHCTLKFWCFIFFHSFSSLYAQLLDLCLFISLLTLKCVWDVLCAWHSLPPPFPHAQMFKVLAFPLQSLFEFALPSMPTIWWEDIF